MKDDIEELARQTAARLVTVREYPSGTRFEVLVGGALAAVYLSGRLADEQAGHYRRPVAAAVAAALRTPPGGGPVSEGRLEELRDYWCDPIAADGGTTEGEVRELFAALDHQARLIRWLTGEGAGDDLAAMLARAERRGAERMKAACVAAVRSLTGDVADAYDWNFIDAVERAEVPQ
jgi:hypothetical protein